MLIVCVNLTDSNLCRKTNKPGYYFYNKEGFDDLIFCNEDRECSISEEGNGYFY